MSGTTMLLTYKYRLNPERRQHRALEAILEQQRQLYNAALEERILAWAKGKSVTEVEQSRSLTAIRADDPAFAAVQRRIQRATLKRLDRAYKAFFRRAKAGAGASSGFPKFKGREYFDGFAFDAFQQIKWDGKRLRFAGVPGGLRVHMDRPLPLVADPETGELTTVIKGVWFKREGRIWYCGFQAETPVATSRKGLGNGEVGVDWGTSVLAALSTGETIANPRHGEALQKDVARAQRAVARKRKGSKRRRKARRHLAAVQRRVANRRRTTMDKLSKRLVTHWRTVATERIDAKGLIDAERPGETLPEFVKTRRNRELADAAPYKLEQMIAYKAQRFGAVRIQVEPGRMRRPDGTVETVAPTQECSLCGRMHYKELSDAEHVCTTPGLFFGRRMPRKVNAARVILGRALMVSPPESSGERRPARGTRVAASSNDGGGPVPGGLDGGSDAAVARNAGNGPRRLGNTEGERSPAGRRSPVDLPSSAHDAQRRAAGSPQGSRPARPTRTSGW